MDTQPDSGISQVAYKDNFKKLAKNYTVVASDRQKMVVRASLASITWRCQNTSH